MKILQVVFVSVLLTAMMGCQTTKVLKKTASSRANSLEASVSAYRKALRWGYFEDAALYIRSQDGSSIPVDLDRVKRYRVTSYSISRQILADTNDIARVNAQIEYYELDSGIALLLNDVQQWWYDVKEERWYLGSPLPAFGRR
ncbi:MAG: hypothetical protein AAF384_08045 [Pseudomonadota bacterium]